MVVLVKYSDKNAEKTASRIYHGIVCNKTLAREKENKEPLPIRK